LITVCTGFSSSLAVALVVAGVDERHRPLHQLHDRDVAGRADLQRADLRRAVDDLGRRVVAIATTCSSVKPSA
jgi:hypothetical protein